MQFPVSDCLSGGMRQDFHTDLGNKKSTSSEHLNGVWGGLCTFSGDDRCPGQYFAILPIPHPGLFANCSPFRIPSHELSGGHFCLWVGVAASILCFCCLVEVLMLHFSWLELNIRIKIWSNKQNLCICIQKSYKPSPTVFILTAKTW